jgi:tetratricopeptide (TPR) repeat protein
LGLPLLLGGCAGLPQQAEVSPDDLAWVDAGAGLLPASGGVPVEDLSSLMRVTPEMRSFAHRATDGRSGFAAKATALADALGDVEGRHVVYDADATLTAQQAFEQRRANCLSYTLLYVALAREVDIPAQFNEVDIPPVWDLGDDKTSVLYRHINAKLDLPTPYYRIIDVSGDEYDPAFDQRVIPDSEAMAQFYNNRAVELRLQQHLPEALRYQLRALELAPEVAYLWTNLADLYLLDGNLRAARIAVTQALKVDPSSMLSYDAAAHVYEQMGQPVLARYFHDRAQVFLDQNPYYHYQLALEALRDGNDKVAFTEGRRAILIYPKDGRFFFLMAVVLDRMGDLRLSSESLQAALKLSPDAAQQERYKSKFARLTNQG